jgi:hypothetical protein
MRFIIPSSFDLSSEDLTILENIQKIKTGADISLEQSKKLIKLNLIQVNEVESEITYSLTKLGKQILIHFSLHKDLEVIRINTDDWNDIEPIDLNTVNP